MTGALLGNRTGIDTIRRALARERRLYEICGEGAAAAWTEAAPTTPFAWDRPRPLVSAKPFFFPPRERLLAWRGDDVQAVESAPDPFALIGLHACDATAIAYQDRFFAADPWYQARRARAFLVVVDCLAACAGGFCRDVAAGPFAHAGFDLCLTPLPDGRVLVQTGSEAGGALLAAAGIPPGRVADDVVRLHATAEARAAATFPDRPFIARAIARIDARTIPDAEWHAPGPACFACTGCTSLCPTCSCFTVVDAAADDTGERGREWDSCLLEGFQREATGHQPAPHAGDRVRRFWTHKLEHTFARAFGRLGCVGCGRCDVTCPGSIGALKVLAALGDG